MCNQCGACCRYVALYYPKDDFHNGMDQWALTRGIVFEELDEKTMFALIEHLCPHLKGVGGKYTCDIYFTGKLPEICRKRPGASHMKMFPKCNYNLEIINEMAKQTAKGKPNGN